MKKYFQLLRPSQWIKNTFVFAPLVFSKHLFDIDWFFLALRGFVAFCIVSSAVYIINDIFDKNADRAHPFKKNRPIASGSVSISSAIFISVALVGVGGLLSFSLDLGFRLILLSYFVLQFCYSVALKRIAILDVFIIASGFMLRVLGGAMLINVLVSHWIILCTMFLSLFVALAKRRGEIVLSERSESPSQRKVLAQYDTPFLDGTMMITASGMAISYALYTVADRTVNVFGTDYLIFTTIFVLFGIFRYLFLVMRKNMGENSVAIILKDVPMFVDLCLWFLSCVLIIYH
ncbi:MAG TPA: decaprenyl-phosphate phosphoribosyltransferase [Bacteroidota bacterium]|nr:decaprenyl-phosphate phosphoribosyltransferase [Bacteroidota bacterium]